MVIYRPGVGRVYGRGRSRPFEVDSDKATPHPGFDERTGLAREAEVAVRVVLPSGLVVESYGQYRDAGHRPSAPPALEPEAPPLTPPAPAKDWRKGFGLNSEA